jgi:hypothetical protein
VAQASALGGYSPPEKFEPRTVRPDDGPGQLSALSSTKFSSKQSQLNVTAKLHSLKHEIVSSQGDRGYTNPLKKYLDSTLPATVYFDVSHSGSVDDFYGKTRAK